jgi:hypothetical protein
VTQALLPSEAWYFPVAQLAQADAEAAEYVPVAHAFTADDPEGQ